MSLVEPIIFEFLRKTSQHIMVHLILQDFPLARDKVTFVRVFLVRENELVWFLSVEELAMFGRRTVSELEQIVGHLKMVVHRRG